MDETTDCRAKRLLLVGALTTGVSLSMAYHEGDIPIQMRYLQGVIYISHHDLSK